MRKPASMMALEELGRIRLSEHFFIHEMLYSEIAHFDGIPNVPDDPDLAIAAGTRLCEEPLEPLVVVTRNRVVVLLELRIAGLTGHYVAKSRPSAC